MLNVTIKVNRRRLYVFASIRRNCAHSLPVNRVSRHILPFTNLLIMRDVVYARLISSHLRVHLTRLSKDEENTSEESAGRGHDFLSYDPTSCVVKWEIALRNRSVMAVYENMRLPRGLIPLTATKSACDRNFSSIRTRDFRFVGRFFSFSFFFLLRLRSYSLFLFLFYFFILTRVA